jgi:DNA-binding transcriptional LysR family regulator
VLPRGSLSGAERSLGVTQLTVTRQIDTVEGAQHGVFVRTYRGLSRTAASLRLQPYAETLVRVNLPLL